MRFARWVFLAAGVYGVLIMTPHYILEHHVNRHHPPPINHPEFYYGFVGVTLAWQVLRRHLLHRSARPHAETVEHATACR
jgi:hypothetical protein